MRAKSSAKAMVKNSGQTQRAAARESIARNNALGASIQHLLAENRKIADKRGKRSA